jgi:hypothetical protein
MDEMSREVPGFEFDQPRASGYGRRGPEGAQPRRPAWLPTAPPTQPEPWGQPPPSPYPQQPRRPRERRPQFRPNPSPPAGPSRAVGPTRAPSRAVGVDRRTRPDFDVRPRVRVQLDGGHAPPPEAARPSSHARTPEPTRSGRLARDVLAAMKERNLLISLALPLLAAIAVGVAAVVIVGANNSIGSAPTAIDAGFPPARVATADFGGGPGAGGTGVQLSAITAAGPAEVAAGSTDGGLGLWLSEDGGSTWQPGAVTASAGVRRGDGQLTAVAHGPSGWLAVGDTMSRAGAAAPLVLASQGGRTWLAEGGDGAFAEPGRVVTAAAAADGSGYVVVGHTTVGGRTAAAAWYAPGLTGWRRATSAEAGALAGAGNRIMNAVTATGSGFAAVGADGGRPAAWLSGPGGRTWSLVRLPLPAGAASAALDFVAANGSTLAAAGTEVTAAGQRLPFAAVSADGGAAWALTALPPPSSASGASSGAAAAAAGAVTATTVTALTAAGGGFTATGTYGAPGQANVVVWTLTAKAAGGNAGDAWNAVAPAGTGLASRGMQAITALTATGDTMIGVGFTSATAAGPATEPTIWQSPVRS